MRRKEERKKERKKRRRRRKKKKKKKNPTKLNECKRNDTFQFVLLPRIKSKIKKNYEKKIDFKLD
jgi:hypothetical protein